MKDTTKFGIKLAIVIPLGSVTLAGAIIALANYEQARQERNQQSQYIIERASVEYQTDRRGTNYAIINGRELFTGKPLALVVREVELACKSTRPKACNFDFPYVSVEEQNGKVTKATLVEKISR